MVSTCPLIFIFSILFTKTLAIVPSAPITIGITITFMFLIYCNFSNLWSAGTAKFIIMLIVFFSLHINRSGRRTEIWWSVSKSQRILSLSFSSTDSALCISYLFVWENFNLMHNSQWVTLPTQSCDYYTLLRVSHIS